VTQTQTQYQADAGGSVLEELLEGEFTPTKLNPVVEALTRAEIDVQIATANKYPRSLKKFYDDALQMATMNEAVASSLMYSVPRGDKQITGPSVRMAEIVASAYRNIRVDCRVVEVGDTFLTARAVCIDLERNNAQTVEVRRRITDKYGRKYNEDMIGVTAQAAISIAKRNAIFSVVPRVYVDPILEEARKVAVGTQQTLGDRRRAMLAHFAQLGVTADRVFARVGVTGEADITLDLLAILKGYATAIKTNEVNIETVFPTDAGVRTAGDSPSPKVSGVAAKIEQARATRAAAAAAKPAEPSGPRVVPDDAVALDEALSGTEQPWETKA
jgi:hypothetical protein